MKMLSERGFNIHMFPMIQRRGRVFEGNYVRKNSKGEVVFIATESSRWNLRCYKFMDWLSSKIKHDFDSYMIQLDPNAGPVKNVNDQRLAPYILLPRPDYILNILEGLNDINSGSNAMSIPYQKFIKISFKEVAKDLKWEKKHVKQTIEMISNCKFKTRYGLKSQKIGSKTPPHFKHGFTNLNTDFQSMFEVLKENCGHDWNPFKVNKDECFLTFNTGFGICFLHNIITNGYELIDDCLYNLSESAQIIYRRRFFTVNRMKAYVNMDWVFNTLGITSKNKTEKKKLYHKIIEELVELTDVMIHRKVSDESYYLWKGHKEPKKIIQMHKIR